MDFARRQRDPRRHVVGLTFVIVFHLVVIWGLMTGLAQKAVEVVKKPITATIVEEIKKPPPPPPPPPPKRIVEPPKVQAPVQPYVPPPDIPAPTPPPEAPVIQSTPVPPPEPYVIAPPPPPVVIAPPAPPAKPTIRRNPSRLSGDDPAFPAKALRDRVHQGRVVAQLYVDEKGNVTEVRITSSQPARVFDEAARTALMTWKFPPSDEKWIGELEIGFTAN